MTPAREMIVFIVLLVLLIGLLAFFRITERRRLRKRTLETMSPGLRGEIEKERQENLQKKQKFDEAMQRASGGGSGPGND